MTAETNDTAGNADRAVAGILQSAVGAGSGSELTIADIVKSLGDASFGPLLLVPALIAVSPLSGIPGLSSVCGVCIVLIAAQWLIGRSHIWLPGWLMRRHVERERFETAVNALEKPVGFIDRVTRPRLSALMHRPLSWLSPLICLAAGLIMPFLELIPFSASMMGAVVTLLAIANVTRDGLFAMLGYAAVVCAAGAITAITLLI
ncbi:exopolysaccharide biosynthesis protein [Pararhizobium mangrovi]|uniref:Exopolysaccharide biosynthesis protein n=1 Tax=Pararhizobium mangrovi TaxID=2590452 RepID=A0A506U1Y6_9HYPH|nr:exopolysaccharide biosynthesis protein [Pararhizobium mangrovi]TPW27780.1 exopolysaccharide biosynthesis protein [Pararhizobium mangrovi]